jgi:hypothetical protein
VQCAHYLEALNGGVSGLERLETSNWPDQLFELIVVGLNDVVQVFDLTMNSVVGAFTFLFQLGEGRGVGRRLVSVDDGRLLPIFEALQRLAEKPLGCGGVARRREVEVYRVAAPVDSPIQIGPINTDFDGGLVDTPARRAQLAPLPARAPFDLWRLFLNPSIDRGVVD